MVGISTQNYSNFPDLKWVPGLNIEHEAPQQRGFQTPAVWISISSVWILSGLFSRLHHVTTSVSRMSAWYHFQMNSRGNFDHLFLWLCPFSSPTTSVHLNVFDCPAVFNQLFGWSCFAQISGHVSFWNGRMDLIVPFFPLTLFKIALLNRSKTCATGKLMIGGSSVQLRSYFRK